MIAVAAIGIIGAGWSVPAAAQGAGACAGGGKISKTIARPMAAAQEAQKARRWQDMLAKVREAEQTPGAKTRFDLPAFVLGRIAEAGILRAEWVGRDTCADEDFYSNRRATRRGEPDYGRLLSAITLV